MRYVTVQVIDNGVQYYRVADTGTDIDATVYVGAIFASEDLAATFAAGLNG